MTPYVSDPDFQLFLGDVREVLKQLPSESVQCVVTSPPYWGLRDYGCDGQLGLEPAPEAYVAAMTDVLLQATGLPYVIENVPGARAELVNPVVLTGEMFGLRVHRPRLFETNWPILVPRKPPVTLDTIGVYGKAHDGRLLWRRADGSEQHAASSLEEAREAMGMPWASWRGLAEAVPPAYTELIGTQLMAIVESRVAA